MELEAWLFQVDLKATREKTAAYALDHCECAYCRNYYETMGHTYPGIPEFLLRFGVNFKGPVEAMPYEPMYVLACYRVFGEVLHWGTAPIEADGVPVSVGAGEEGTFQLWIGEMELPWIQTEPMEKNNLFIGKGHSHQAVSFCN